MNAVEELIVNRRTINTFKPEIPSKKNIIEAIEIARWAPNHHLTQPWHYYILNSQMIDQVVNLNAELVTANKGKHAGEKKRKRWRTIPGWLVVTCERSGNELLQQEDYAACSCSIYALSLVLWHKGVGIKWTTGSVIRDQRFYDICWLDYQSQMVVGLIWYGYPDQIPPPQQRQRIEETVTIY